MARRAWNRLTFDDLSWFWARVDKNGPNGCWLWTGTIEVQGYGVVTVSGKMYKAHVVAFESLVRPKVPGEQLDHLCRVRPCVNPAHLEPVDLRTNVLRGFGPTAINAAKDECDNGHPFDGENTYWRKNGNRDCRACRRARSNSYYYRVLRKVA